MNESDVISVEAVGLKNEVLEELIPLFVEHYNESKVIDRQLAIKYELLLKLDEMNMLYTFVFRKENEVVGYSIYMVMDSLFTNELEAKNIGLFIKKEHRGFGKLLIPGLDQALRHLNEDIECIHYSCKQSDERSIFKKLGYTKLETIYSN